MTAKKVKKKQKEMRWLVPVLGTGFLAVVGGGAYLVMNTKEGDQKKVQVVNLIKPPPPEVKEKLPEPEVPKEVPKETIETPVEAPAPDAPQDSPPDNSPPPGADLGVDAEGGTGSDGFGLVGKKGGRAITLGEGGGGEGGNGPNRLSLLSRYGGYARKMQSDVEKRTRELLAQNGGRPKGKQETTVKITLARDGSVVKFAIVGSSGIERLDAAFGTVLEGLKLSEAPPAGMPLSMTLTFITKA